MVTRRGWFDVGPRDVLSAARSARRCHAPVLVSPSALLSFPSPPCELFGFLRRSGFAQPDAGSPAVLIDELDAGRLQGSADGGIVGGRHRGCAFGQFGPPDGGHPHRGILRQILGAPAQKRPRGFARWSGRDGGGLSC